MAKFEFSYGANVNLEQRVGFEMAAAIWASFLTDDVTVKLQIGAVSELNDGSAVGGAVPILHNQNYGVFQEYYKQDASSDEDTEALDSLQEGNTVDFSVGGEVIDGNTEIVLTSAQAKALGMDKAITLDNGTTWDRNLIDANSLDGYIVISNSFDWNYDFTRAEKAPEGTLDFLSMALHEIGHNLGFVSGLDGLMDIIQQHSGDTSVEDFTALDLFRHTVNTATIQNTDGSVSSADIGGNAYFSIDGGQTNLGDFSTGKNTEQGGDGFQASHWKRLKIAMGIMDPTLAAKERLSMTELDLQALDVLGWDINYSALVNGLNLDSLRQQAEHSVAIELGMEAGALAGTRTSEHAYALSHDQVLNLIQDQMIALGYGKLWQAFELGYGKLWQIQENGIDVLELGYGKLWQQLEATLFELGYGKLWQEFQGDIFELGYGKLWQMFELSYGKLWQELESHAQIINQIGSYDAGNEAVSDHSDVAHSVVVAGGDADDIIAGGDFRDLVSGGKGDDVIEGKDGKDTLLGEDGNDILYGALGEDKLYGGSGDDFLAGEGSNDKLYGEDGHDILSGGAGNDILDGGTGKDLLKGDAGNDVLDGGADNDDLNGGDDSDIIIGGNGEDIVSGGRGDDTLYGDSFIEVSNEQSSDLEEISKQAGFTTDENVSPVDFWVRLELEDFKLENFSRQEEEGFISTGGKGKAETRFTGPTGTYDLVIGYYDESDGNGELQLEVEGLTQRSQFDWLMNQDFQNAGAGIDNFTTRTIRGVEIKSGGDIKLIGTSEGYEFMRVDYIDVISTTEGTAFEGAQFYNGKLYLPETTGSVTDTVNSHLVEAVQGSAEAHWLKNTLGGTEAIVSVDVSNSQFTLVQDQITISENSTLRLEAESFDLSGEYAVEHRDDFASGSVIAINGNNSGEATSAFTGESGTYDIFVSYLENSGVGGAIFAVNGQTLDQWYFDGANDTAGLRSVGQRVQLNEGDLIQLQGWANNDDKARIDYVEFVASVVEDSNEASEASSVLVTNSEGVTPVGEETLIEAENIWFDGTGFKAYSSTASGGRYATLNEASGTTLFTGETGYYDVIVSHLNNASAATELSLKLNEDDLDRWQVEQQGGTTGSFIERTVASGVKLTNNSDYLKLAGTTASNARGHVDYIKLVRVEEPNTPVTVVETDDSENSDILRGGQGNDTVYGGEGNDIIYGEDEFDSRIDSNNNSDILFGGSGNDIIYGNSGDDKLHGDSGQDIVVATSEVQTLKFQQGVDGYTGTADTQIRQYYSNYNLGNHSFLTVDQRTGGYDNQGASQGLLRFDDLFGSQSGQISTDSVINSAVIELEVYNTGSSFNVHEMLHSWEESSTWNSLNYGIQTNNWEASEAAVAVAQPGQLGTITVDVTASLQAWQADPSSNQGWAFLSTGSDGVDFYSSESGYAPRLVVDTEKTVTVTQSFADRHLSDNDNLVGGAGNDELEGGIGDDRLEGSDEIALGAFEQDILVGGEGSDTFVLGTTAQSYYISDGNNDYAVVEDFDAASDVLQLHGSSGDYGKWQYQGNLWLLNKGDLVAIVNDTDSLDLNGSSVTFVR